MGKPREEVDHKDYFKDIHFLYEIFSSLKNTDEVKLFIKDLLTRSELRMLKRRWHVANLLNQRYDIRTVANMSKTSTATVNKIKRIIEEGNGGLSIAMKRAQEREIKDKKKFLKSKSRGGSKFVKNWF